MVLFLILEQDRLAHFSSRVVLLGVWLFRHDIATLAGLPELLKSAFFWVQADHVWADDLFWHLNEWMTEIDTLEARVGAWPWW